MVVFWVITAFTGAFMSYEIYLASIDPGTSEVDEGDDTSDLVTYSLATSSLVLLSSNCNRCTSINKPLAKNPATAKAAVSPTFQRVDISII